MNNPNNPTGERPPERSASEIAEELRLLGKNLKEVMRAAWESDERKKFQQEIQAGLKDLGITINEVANDFNQSPAAQRVREEAADLRQRMRNGEVEARIRSEVINALRTVNSELEKAAHRKPSEAPSSSESGTEKPGQG